MEDVFAIHEKGHRFRRNLTLSALDTIQWDVTGHNRNPRLSEGMKIREVFSEN